MYLLLVGKPDAPVDAEPTVAATADVQLTDGKDVELPISDKSASIVSEILRQCGQATALINNTVRTPDEQASAMYNNLQHHKGRNYKQPGQMVIAVYDSLKKVPGETPAMIIDAMSKEIGLVGPYMVSHHCATPDQFAALNVFDIDPKSVTNRALFERIASLESGVTFLGPRNDDPAFHFEIKQGS
jgi:hypothetical protein